MKKLILLLLIGLLSGNAYGEYVGTAAIGTVTTNPANTTTLVTTGNLASGCAAGSGHYVVQVYVTSGSTSPTTFDMQSVFSGSVVSHLYINVPANTSFNWTTSIDFNVPDGISLQIVNVGAITGVVQTNIYYTMRSC